MAIPGLKEALEARSDAEEQQTWGGLIAQELRKAAIVTAPLSRRDEMALRIFEAIFPERLQTVSAQSIISTAVYLANHMVGELGRTEPGTPDEK